MSKYESRWDAAGCLSLPDGRELQTVALQPEHGVTLYQPVVSTIYGRFRSEPCATEALARHAAENAAGLSDPLVRSDRQTVIVFRALLGALVGSMLGSLAGPVGGIAGGVAGFLIAGWAEYRRGT